MRQPITPTMHGVADYLSSATFAAAPNMIRMPDTAAKLSRALGASYAGMSAATAYPLGAVKVIPFPAHLAADAVVGVGLAAAPWLLGFADHKPARNFFLAMAAVSAVVTSLSQRRRAA